MHRTGARVVVDESFYSHAGLYDLMLTRARSRPDPRAAVIGVGDFELRHDRLASCLDVVVVCR